MSNLSLQPYDHAKVAELDEHAKRLGVMIHIDGVPFGTDSDNVSTPQSTGLSAIAQERDVVQINDLIKNLDWYGKHYFPTVSEHGTLSYDRCMRLSEMCTEAADTIRHLTTSPSAISEAPISAEAVKSNDVAEMVERLLQKFEVDAASLLQSLARERERLRKLAQLVVDMHRDVDLGADIPREIYHEARDIIEPRSALPHPDTKGT